MVQHPIDRRRMIALAAAGVAGLSRARAAIIEQGEASRLTPLADLPYTPPTNIAMVADIYRRMTAQVRIAGQGPFAFVVDTGANRTVIADTLIERLGLPLNAPTVVNGVAGGQMEPTTVAALTIGGRLHPPQILSVLPETALGGPGLLGLDALDGQRLTLDFRGQTLRIEQGGRSWPKPGEITVRARRRNGQLTLVDADLAGIPIVAFLDSGAQNTIGNMVLRRMALSRRAGSLWLKTPIVSVTGQVIDAEMADLPRLRVGGMKLPNWPVAFADLHTFRMWNLTDRPAILLGVDVLSRFESVCLDFARNEVRFRLPDAASVFVAGRRAETPG